MPRRTLTVTNFYVHTERKGSERRDVANFDGKGADLLVLLRAFIHGLDPNVLVDNDHERYVSVTELEPSGRTLFVEVEAGWFGTTGKVKNVVTHDVKHVHSADEATTRTLRFLAVAPVGAKGMLVFVERVGGQSSAARILQLFHAALRAKFNGEKLSFKVDSMVESEAWLDGAELEQVSGVVTSYNYSSDKADAGGAKEIGQLRVELVPTGAKQYLPKLVWKGLKSGDLKAAEVFGLAQDLDVDEVRVKVSNEGKAKSFAIDKEREPALSYLMLAKGTLETDDFLAYCHDRAEELLPSVGAEWKSGLTGGSWTSEQLAVTLESPGEQ